MRKIRSRAGDTANGILYRETGRYDDAAEEALWQANPGLAAYGPTLPAGVTVYVPEIEETPTPAKVTNVWD